jgi:hypothetical protein
MDGTTPDGTKALRNYLEYARTGSLTTIEETDREPDSDFEISVMDMLKLRGYEVTPQLGVAGYRIDIAVKHPDAPGSYLAAIECDGATPTTLPCLYEIAIASAKRSSSLLAGVAAFGASGLRTGSVPQDKKQRSSSASLRICAESWKPEHASGEAWIEEGQGAGQPDIE